MKNTEPCPVCQWQSEIETLKDKGQFVLLVSCHRCGIYLVDDVVRGYLRGEDIKNKSAVLSHSIRKMQKNYEYPFLDFATINNIKNNPLPKPAEQLNNFLLWLGEHIPSLGDKIIIDGLELQAEIGARTQEGLEKIVDHLKEKRLVEGRRVSTNDIFNLPNGPRQFEVTLTMDGWENYEKLKLGKVASRRVFMAMKFGDSNLDDMVEQCFRPAIKDTGFELFRLDDEPRAGLIDDRMRVEIRASRFLIADLTHENAGAYWEAGYAEGLGKPVIYTCEKKKFDEKKTHFDTNHHLTVLWDKDDLENTARNLKNTIRATLPEEAKMNDERK